MLPTFSKYGKCGGIIHVVLLLTAVVQAGGEQGLRTLVSLRPPIFSFFFLYRFWPFSFTGSLVEETGYQHVLNMAAKSAIERGISTIWQKILTVVNNALVYLDSRTAEWIHWCGSLQDFIDAGALNVCDISSARVSTAAQ